MSDHDASRLSSLRDVLAAAGETGRLALEVDWARTSIGPMEAWPDSLCTAVGICFASRFPILLWWGEDLVGFYNDACRPVLGGKHPAGMGRPARETWPEVWSTVGPMLEGVRDQGDAVWAEDQHLVLERSGFREECFFTFSYSPIHRVDGGIGGVFCAVHETTGRVVGERRLRALREVAERTAEARTADGVAAGAAAALAGDAADVPFALVYLLEGDGASARLAAATGIAAGDPGAPVLVALDDDGADWPLAAVAERGEAIAAERPSPPLGDPAAGALAHTAMVLPIADIAHGGVAGMLVAGVGPGRPLDDDMRAFLALAAGHVETALAEARAFQDERKRAEALAELNRAKTDFFSNVSHEFRTPLTLLLGPLEDALADAGDPLGPRQAARVATAARNGERLLKLVNSLLEFSRAEAGREQASFAPTDLASLTTEVAGVFRAAVERAGLRFDVRCPPLAARPYVDADMWERIVLNLLSNALKFTMEGSIAVVLRQAGDAVELQVADTGVGIPAEELPHLFERFHRVRGAQGRSHEGSGIGLALVHELAGLHGGTVEVRSEPGRGSEFTVRIPLGAAHLPVARIGAPRAEGVEGDARRAYVEEAMPTAGDSEAPPAPADPLTRVLVVDDNADMRAYLRRLLAPHWQVEVATDGEEALRAIRDAPPDIVLTDVMMPRLDGFGLLRALRDDPRTRRLPVLVLSARAGEEASVEGLDAGADDYVVKPFSARELIARVRVHLELARARAAATAADARVAEERSAHEQADRFAALAGSTSDFVGLASPDGHALFVNPAGRRMIGLGQDEDVTGMSIADFHPVAGFEAFERDAISTALRDGIWKGESLMRRRDGTAFPVSQVIVVERDAGGGAAFFATIARDITAERVAAERLREAEERFRHAFEDAPAGMAMLDGDEGLRAAVLRANPVLCRLTGHSPGQLTGMALDRLVHPDDHALVAHALGRIAEGGPPFSWEATLVRADGTPMLVALDGSSSWVGEGVRQVILHVQDITERKRDEGRLRELADRDPLTGLLNRRTLIERLETEVAQVRRHGGSGALLLLDLDDFKYVNDSLGHAAGDALIVRVAQQIGQRLRDSDSLGRLGGDEFGAILPHTDEQGAVEVASALLRTIRDGVKVPGATGSRRITASVGISLYGEGRGDELTSERLLAEADIAMYDSKDAGRDRIALFDPDGERQSAMEARLGWAERLRRALDGEGLLLHAQPIVPLQDGTGAAYELLVRMRDDERGPIPPAVFLDAAERFDLIQALDRWVVGRAIALLAAERRAGRATMLSVNISARSLIDPELPGWVAAELEAAGIDGHGLVFEVTETAAVVNFDAANALARRLAALGIEFALDDFGTGFCSFHYLTNLAFDYLKIDGEFIRDLAHNATNQLIVGAAVDIARGLGKRTIAEFVESDETLEMLRARGVDLAQGFHLGEPVPVEELGLGAPPGVEATP